MTVFFTNMVNAAQFAAELTRQGIAFRAREKNDGLEFELTGY